LNEGNANRQNADRLFDSQNNAAGGYGIGTRMSYYEGSWLTLEWTNQHSCGYENNHCQIIFQYMCQAKDSLEEVRIRDGTTTDNIPNDENYNQKTAGGEDFTYGMHEPKKYYNECQTRERNKGLFKADRNLGGNPKAVRTRQNNNGNRSGFECPEERDHYPYWHPSPWKDIVVMTTDTSMCSYYQSESQNVMDKGHCINEDSEEEMENAWEFNNDNACKQAGHDWVVDSKWDIAEPECLSAPWSRDNHLGNGITDTLSGYMSHYNWSLPTSKTEPCIEEDNCVCVLRLRYNISTYDYEGRDQYEDFVDASMNSDEAEDALVLQDPYVTVAGQMLSLALNTNQYGRTFQDRSHTFEIRPRPTELSFGQRIFNLNVRGKRGNIVQTYPAVEYDFVPQHLVVRQYDYVHFQWTGFNDNNKNGNNNGEGTDGTDRSNIVQLAHPGDNYPMSETGYDDDGITPMFEDKRVRFKFAGLDQGDCASLEELNTQNDNNNAIEQDARNCFKLNNANAYFDGGIYRQNSTGVVHYMSSRNNNFSNRSQKASLISLPILPTWAIAVTAVGGVLCLSSIAVGALMLNAKKNPMSRYASWFDKI